MTENGNAATRRCPHCERVLPVEAFGMSSKTGRQSYCRECNTLYARDWIARNRDKTSANKLWTQYRLRPDDLLTLRTAQSDACGLCGRQFNNDWHIDHDHECCPGKRSCGKCIRGLLCPRCNVFVGWVEAQWDDPEMLAAGLRRYLAVAQPSPTQ